MTNLIDIQGQIEKLQKQAAEIKSKEFSATVRDIQAKMQAFGITMKDLQSGKGAKGSKGAAKAGRAAKVKAIKVPKAGRKVGQPVAAKYRGPNGETWSGRGLTPKWLTSLIAQGQAKESFAVASTAS